MDIKRRTLLKATAISMAMAAAGCQQKEAKPAGAQAKAASIEPDEWKKTVCRFCGTGCGILVGVKDGKVIATKGDPENGSNMGLNCVKGYYVGKLFLATTG
ncbi:hypothetical protein [Bacillus sp. FJAT-18017]|uniref:hypothetical protein n=1 Tax=Bacillus sp. FJAT-18017 TaxID=1705566 RepID=UPI000AE95AEB|nr:hypothetical protein [Bacillus sp. FJAT-18017]